MTADYPRVLIVGQDFTEATGGGITLSCLFARWPKDRVAVANGERDLGASGFAGHYYRLGTLEDRWRWPLSSIPREDWKVSGPFQSLRMSTEYDAGGNTLEQVSNVLPGSSQPPGVLRNVFDKTLGLLEPRNSCMNCECPNLSWPG